MITGIILASGYSRRMKKDKLIMNIKDKPMVEWVIKAAVDSKLDEVILVYRTVKVKEIGTKYGIKTLYNPKAYLGQSEGLKLGVRYAQNSSAYMFLVGDMPYINSQLIDKLIDEYKKNLDSLIVPFYNGKQGMPTIFPSLYRESLLNTSGDKGGRDIIKENFNSVKKVYIKEGKLGLDIDNLEDMKKIK
ncbi:MAG: NTP transferase domain-containing protein [Tissierellia bacterium]|nr:NTP transferase domain-containing protein [Tissierellia bacterium]